MATLDVEMPPVSVQKKVVSFEEAPPKGTKDFMEPYINELDVTGFDIDNMSEPEKEGEPGKDGDDSDSDDEQEDSGWGWTVGKYCVMGLITLAILFDEMDWTVIGTMRRDVSDGKVNEGGKPCVATHFNKSRIERSMGLRATGASFFMSGLRMELCLGYCRIPCI